MRKLQLSHKITDLLGFVISMEEYIEEDKIRQSQFSAMQQRDLEWIQYLKSIGGPENLKPAGVFKVTFLLLNCFSFTFLSEILYFIFRQIVH